MKYLPNIAAILLFLIYGVLGLMVLLHLMPTGDKPPLDTPIGQFTAACDATGFMTFVKVFEVLGGILVVIPKTRNLGLLVLGPIAINILAFHILFLHGAGFADPMSAIPTALATILPLYLLIVERKKFAGLLK